MRATDAVRFTLGAVLSQRLRSSLTLLAMAIGVAAVVLLTALGEGARQFVVGEFAALGTNLLIVIPGRAETVGGMPPLLAETPRDLTVDDARALERCAGVRRVAPLTVGGAEVAWGGRSREVTILGSTAALREVRHLRMGSGRFLPPGRDNRQVAVLGAKVREELFGPASPLGEWVRVGDRRYRVIGTLDSRGRSIGLDLDEMVVLPVEAAQVLFDTASLFRIMVETTSHDAIPQARRAVLETLTRRHDGEEDVTVITQDAVLGTFDRILSALTLGVGGIAGISLIVAGVLVMNVMLVSVAERSSEIGLLQALGSPAPQVLTLFLLEAATLSVAGGLIGLAIGQGGVALLCRIYPALPFQAPLWAVGAAMGTALVTGLIFGVLPARRASRLDPVVALGRR